MSLAMKVRLEFDTGASLDAGIEGMFDFHHLCHRIGVFNQGGRSVPTSDDQVLSPRLIRS